MQPVKTYFSLEGFTAILLGIYGLAAVYLINILTSGQNSGIEMVSQLPLLFLQIAVTAVGFVFVIFSLISIWVLARSKAKKEGQKLWNADSKKLRFQTLVSLVFFIVIVLIVANKGYYSLVTPISLFLYGVFLLNLGRLTHKQLIFLAIAELVLAALSYFIYDTEMIFLAIGFGVFHILYGIITLFRPRSPEGSQTVS